MPSARGKGSPGGIPPDPSERRKIRNVLNDQERELFDSLTEKLDQGKKLNKQDHQFIRKLKAQRKIRVPSKSFQSPSDKKTHQDE